LSLPGFLLLQTLDDWRITPAGRLEWTMVADARDVEPDALAEGVAEYCRAQGAESARLVMALDARSTLAGSFDIEPGDERHRSTLDFELETLLPWSAEETVADYLVQATSVLGVGIERACWVPLVAALEDRGLHVESIGSALMMAVQGAGETGWLPREGGLVWPDEEMWHVVRLVDGRPRHWSIWQRGDPLITSEIAESAESSESHAGAAAWLLCGDDPVFEGLPNDVLPVDVERADVDSFAEHVRVTADLVLRGVRASWIELRRGPLVLGSRHRALRGGLLAAAAGLGLFLLACITAFGYRAVRNDREAERLRAEQIAVYRRLFPGKRVPVAVVARLRSEHARRLASRRIPADINLPRPAMSVLYDFLRGMPEKPRLHVRELRIEDGQLDLQGDVKRHSDANAVARSLREAGFDVPPPSTEQNADRSVAVRLFARWQPPTPTAKRPAGRNVSRKGGRP